MHPNRTSGGPPRRSVSGLGVCDALRLELEPIQLPWLVDELEEMRGPIEEQLARGTDSEDDLRYELRLLRLLRAQLPAAAHAEPVAVVGPAGMLTRAALAALRSAIAALHDLAEHSPYGDATDYARLRDAAAAAAAWTRTVIDCRVVEAFSFDPTSDPHGCW